MTYIIASSTACTFGIVLSLLFTPLMVAIQTLPAAAQNDVFESVWGSFGDDESDDDYDEVRERFERRKSARRFSRNYHANPARGFATLAPGSVKRMREAIRRYSRIVSDGGWRPLPTGQLRLGDRKKAVRLLRYRLQTTGDLPARSGYSPTFDKALERGVKNFQTRHGLTPNGIADLTTIKALNVPASTRLRQLRTNLVRLMDYEKRIKHRYVLVNIPSAQIEAVEHGRVISRHSGVVGKVDRQTPILQSDIHEINFNPFWTVPKSIVRKDLVPKAYEYSKRGRDIMDVYRMNAYDLKGNWVHPSRIDWNSPTLENEITFRQDPWKENSMGFVKINFNNEHAVFMHDTPSKSLFGRGKRAESSGCIRVHNVGTLVNWLLRANPEWDNSRVQYIKQSGERVDVALNEKVPVFFVYVTAWMDDDGIVNFRRDLYRRDNVGQTASSY